MPKKSSAKSSPPPRRTGAAAARPPAGRKTANRAPAPPPADSLLRLAPRQNLSGCPIVVIGASAGGLDAFKKFFAAMPADSGMAFVLIPHLDPTHESLMVKLLAKGTHMPVLQAAHGVLIRPNHVYVIPPNRYLAIRQHHLALSDMPKTHTGQTGIDFALRSLAEDQGDRAIGIVLSGTGSHGTAGLKEIKLAGGLVLLQDPTTAQFDQMPRSALDSGMAVDYVLAPEKMPAALIAYVRQSSRRRAVQTEAPDAGTLDSLKAIFALLQARTNLDFRHYRKNMILRRIQRRMALLQIGDVQKYIERLRGDPDEVPALQRDLLIGVTTFFREPEAFNVLATQVLPNLVGRASADTPVRVWVPACSTGEEAYSIAMLLIEQFDAAHTEVHLQMFASDVDEDSLKIARRGVYPDGIAGAVSPERLQRFFVRSESHHYRVCKRLREAVVFARQNLTSDPPFSKLNLISCRNALIYLEPDIQAKVISLLHFALNDGGYLVLGPAESIGRATDLFEPVSRAWRVYRRRGSARSSRPSVPLAAPTGRPAPGERLEPMRRTPVGATQLLQKALLDEFAPAAVLVNREYRILSVQGPVVKYLQIPPGELTHDLLAMVRVNLRAAIRAACERAIRKGSTVRDVNATVRRNGRYLPCSVSVSPIARRPDGEGLLLIVFQDVAPAPSARSRRQGTAREFSTARQLEEELRATRDDLRRTVAELEGSNEDLKASNEEVMSMNEELQSTNEELESSKEELQSLNEALSTANNQLEEKVNDLDAANEDLTRLMAATDIAIVFLDSQLQIRRFTAPAARLLDLLPGDVGRPFLQFAPMFTDDGLAQDARRVTAARTPIETEVHSHGRTYLRRILPYGTAEDPISLIVTFIDVTQRVKAEAQSRRLAAVLRDSSDAILVIALDGRITAWNRGAEILYGHAEADALKMNVAELATEESREQTLAVIRRIAHGEVVPAFEAQRRTRDGQVMHVWTTVTPLREDSGKVALVAMTERDITDDRRRAERQLLTLNTQLEQRVDDRTRELQRAQEQMRAVLDATADGVITIDTSGTIVTFNQSAARLFGCTADEAIGQSVGMLMPPSQRAHHQDYLNRYLQTREPHIIGNPREVDACRRDGSVFPILLSVAEVGHLNLFVGCVRDLTAGKTLQEEVLNIAMLEQRRIGQELHDGTQQELTGLGLLAQNLNEALSRQGSTADAELAGRLASGIAEANLHVRSLARGLVPVPIDAETLPAALGELAKSTRDNYKLSCQLDCPEALNIRDATTATHLFRIAQEAVGNAARHAKADAISIRLRHANGDLVLEVRDNGTGMTPGSAAHGGVGLRLMEHRCTVIGGRFLAQRQEGGGTVVECTIPQSGRA